MISNSYGPVSIKYLFRLVQGLSYSVSGEKQISDHRSQTQILYRFAESGEFVGREGGQ